MSPDIHGRIVYARIDELVERLPFGSIILGWYGLLALVILVGVIARFYHIGDESLWLDEALSVEFVTTMDLQELAVELPRRDPHPPFYYLLLDGWVRLFGTGEVAVRSLSALLGIASIPVLYAVATRLYDRSVGIIAALLFALSPFYIWYAQETRMYALATFLTLVSFYFLLSMGRSFSYQVAAGYLIATILLGYTHVFGWFIILAQNLAIGWVLVRNRQSDDLPTAGALSIKRWVTLQAIIGVSLVPYLWILYEQYFRDRVLEGYIAWIPEPTGETLWGILGAYFGVRFSTVATGLAALAIVLIMLALLTDWRERPRDGPFAATPTLVFWAAVPIGVPFVLSYLMTPLLIDRYTAVAGVAVFILVARGIQVLGRTPRGGIALAIVIGLVLTVPLAGMYADPHKEQWEETVDLVESTAGDDALVLLSPHHPSYEYYATDEDLRIEGTPWEFTRDDIVPLMAGHDEIWLVLSHTSPEEEAKLHDIFEAEGYTVEHEEHFIGIQIYRYVSH